MPESAMKVSKGSFKKYVTQEEREGFTKKVTKSDTWRRALLQTGFCSSVSHEVLIITVNNKENSAKTLFVYLG